MYYLGPAIPIFCHTLSFPIYTCEITYGIFVFEYFCCIDGIEVTLEPACISIKTWYDVHNVFQKCYSIEHTACSVFTCSWFTLPFRERNNFTWFSQKHIIVWCLQISSQRITYAFFSKHHPRVILKRFFHNFENCDVDILIK